MGAKMKPGEGVSPGEGALWGPWISMTIRQRSRTFLAFL